MGERVVVGGASGFWGDATLATRQLLDFPAIDYIVYDYLAEITMSIMARACAKDSSAGYAGDFVTGALAPNLAEIAHKNVRIISNAGGVNPQACAAAVRDLIARAGLDLTVAVVTGDDLKDRAGAFAKAGVTEMFSGQAFPPIDAIASINAYLGAFPIAAALDRGADIVIAGRCVDSAVTLGACIHAFGWTADEYDLLAAGSLAGHIIECGPQATGGNFTDWKDAGDIAGIGYPVAIIANDGSMGITKAPDTSGIVSPASVGEQMLYEIGDPRAYLLPDVICDFSDVTIVQDGQDTVKIAGAKGAAPPDSYKVCATFADGYRAGQLLAFNGFEVRQKAEALANAAIARARNILRSMNAPDYDEISIEMTGDAPDDAYGEIMLKAAVRHRDARAVGIFLKELTGLGLATPPGMSVFSGGGRAKPSPVVRLFSFTLNRNEVPVFVDLGGGPEPLELPCGGVGEPRAAGSLEPERPVAAGTMADVPLIELAWARSGDKGDKANIGVLARDPAFMPWIWAALTEQAIAVHFSGYLEGEVERFYLPGSHSMNILMHEVLGGGGIASLRNDAQGKGFAQMLLAHPVSIPQELTKEIKTRN